jgi:hypothetical protein
MSICHAWVPTFAHGSVRVHWAGMNDAKPEKIRAKSPIPLVRFFENVAPGSFATVSGIPFAVPYNPVGPAPPQTPFPQLKLHCDLKGCDGERIFEAEYTVAIRPCKPGREGHRIEAVSLFWEKATGFEHLLPSN